jgi:uncharacterized membrane protein (UPF0127 family)
MGHKRELKVWCGEKKILSRCEFSGSTWFRMKGLLGRSSLADGEGIWLNPCNSIHMFFMRFAIDAAFLDKERRIVRIYHGIKPWRVSAIVGGAKSVLELPAGTCQKLAVSVGDLLEFREN